MGRKTSAVNAATWTVQGRRHGNWETIPGEQYTRREQANHRRQVYSSLITDAHFRVVQIKDLPRGEEN